MSSNVLGKTFKLHSTKWILISRCRSGTVLTPGTDLSLHLLYVRTRSARRKESETAYRLLTTNLWCQKGIQLCCTNETSPSCFGRSLKSVNLQQLFCSCGPWCWRTQQTDAVPRSLSRASLEMSADWTLVSGRDEKENTDSQSCRFTHSKFPAGITVLFGK